MFEWKCATVCVCVCECVISRDFMNLKSRHRFFLFFCFFRIVALHRSSTHLKLFAWLDIYRIECSFKTQFYAIHDFSNRRNQIHLFALGKLYGNKGSLNILIDDTQTILKPKSNYFRDFPFVGTTQQKSNSRERTKSIVRAILLFKYLRVCQTRH